MKQITIYKNSVITHGPNLFETIEQLEQWFSFHKNQKTFGENEHSYEQLVSELVPAVYEERELFDENGHSFDPKQFETVLVSPEIPAVYETIHVPAEYTYEIKDITAELEAEAAKQAKIEAGKKAREVCQLVLDFIAGSNLVKNLTIEQITEMQTTFANAESALRAGRPTFAKSFISAIAPDGVILTEEEKAECLRLLAGY